MKANQPKRTKAPREKERGRIEPTTAASNAPARKRSGPGVQKKKSPPRQASVIPATAPAAPVRRTSTRKAAERTAETAKRPAQRKRVRGEGRKPKAAAAIAAPQSAVTPVSLNLSLVLRAEAGSMKVEEFCDSKLAEVNLALDAIVDAHEGLRRIADERHLLSDDLGNLRRTISETPRESVSEAEDGADPDKDLREKIEFCRFLIEDYLDERAAAFQKTLPKILEQPVVEPKPVPAPAPAQQSLPPQAAPRREAERRTFEPRRPHSSGPVPKPVTGPQQPPGKPAVHTQPDNDPKRLVTPRDPHADNRQQRRRKPISNLTPAPPPQPHRTQPYQQHYRPHNPAQSHPDSQRQGHAHNRPHRGRGKKSNRK